MRLLRSVAIAAALIAVAVPLSAQSHILGAKLGVSVAGLDGLDDTFDDENTTGVAAGLFYTIGQGALSLQPELNFISKGTEFSSDEFDGSSLDVLYVQPAAVLKAGLPLSGFRPSVFAGVGYGFEADFDCVEAGMFDCHEAEIENEWVGIFGVDLEIWMGALGIVADGRYELGLNDSLEAGDVFEDVSSRAWVFRAGLGWRH